MRTDLKTPIQRLIAAGVLLLGTSITLAPLPVQAQSVRIAGQQVFQVNTGTATLSPNQRTETIQTNLDNAIVASKDKSSPLVGIIYVNGLPVITLAGYQICTVDGADAKQANTTPALLAQKWSDALRKSMNDKQSLSSYIAQLSGASNSNSSSSPSQSSNDTNLGNSNSSSNNNGNTSSNSYPNTSSIPDVYSSSSQPPGAAPQLQSMTPQAAPPSSYSPPLNPGAPYSAYVPPPPASNAAYGYTSYMAPPVNYPGPPPAGYLPPTQYNAPPIYGGRLQGSVATAPAGTVFNAMLKISISTDVAQNGDPVEASILDSLPIQNGSIPAGSMLMGTITQARSSGRLSQSGHLGMKFTTLRTPDGNVTPITAHLTGLVGKYKLNGKGDDTYLHGEGGKAKLGQAVIRGGVGAGAGAALGTAVGAIAGGPFGAGTGAWSGAAIGGGLGLGDMALRKGREVKLESGTRMQIQLDQPATIQGVGNSPYGGGNNI